MSPFKLITEMAHEQVVFCNDPATGLKAIIAIHDTTLGPALGGCRMFDYQSEEDALEDVLRLSKGMTYKAAVTGLPLGGGKAVIIGDPKKLKSDALFRSFGRYVQTLGGRYITAEDVNIRVRDMEVVATETNYVTGIKSIPGGSGDPSPITALGVFSGIRAGVKHRLGKENLQGIRVAVQGCGAVGYHLVKLLEDAGAKTWVCDLSEKKLNKTVADFGSTPVSENEIYQLDVDVFAPCAMGAVINDETIPHLKAKIVSGAANNQLKDEQRNGSMLVEKGILYSPDYVVNAGGLINVLHELQGYNQEIAMREAEKIYETLLHVFEESENRGVPTYHAANLIAERRIDSVRRIRPLNKTYENRVWIRR